MTQCDKLPASAIFHCPFVNKAKHSQRKSAPNTA